MKRFILLLRCIIQMIELGEILSLCSGDKQLNPTQTKSILLFLASKISETSINPSKKQKINATSQISSEGNKNNAGASMLIKKDMHAQCIQQQLCKIKEQMNQIQNRLNELERVNQRNLIKIQGKHENNMQKNQFDQVISQICQRLQAKKQTTLDRNIKHQEAENQMQEETKTIEQNEEKQDKKKPIFSSSYLDIKKTKSKQQCQTRLGTQKSLLSLTMKTEPSNEIVNASDWVDPQMHHYKKIAMKGNTITAIYDGVSIFGKEKLSNKSSFTVKFAKITYLSYQQVGVIDSQLKELNDVEYEKNVVSYSNFKILKYNSYEMKNKGKGYEQREKVTVSVDLAAGIIKWQVGSTVRYQANVPILKNKDIKWVPYIYLRQSQDSVMII